MAAVMLLSVFLFIFLIKTTFSGLGLKSLVLADLQPFTYYTAHVRCGSREHFYKWGDWSDPVTFSTKEDSKYVKHKKKNYIKVFLIAIIKSATSCYTTSCYI